MNDEKKGAILLSCVEAKRMKVDNNLTSENQAQKKEYAAVIQAFEHYFEPQKLLTSYITKFQQRKQNEQETVNE